MQGICLLLTGRSGLTDQNLRHGVLRIPEVSHRIREAQIYIDTLLEESQDVDLMAQLQSSEEVFHQQVDLKNLITAIVQIGLFDRFTKYRNQPQYLIGQSNGTSALAVCCGEMDFKDFILQSDFVTKTQQQPNHLSLQGSALLGQALEEFCLYQWQTASQYRKVMTGGADAASIIEELLEQVHLSQCILVGPCGEARLAELKRKGLDHLPSINSIDMDPMLTSFWRSA